MAQLRASAHGLVRRIRAKDHYFVPVSVKIPGSDIELARKSGAESTRLDFIGEVRDARGMLQGTVRDDIPVKLKGDNVGQLTCHNLEYDTGFTLQPGPYTLKFLARENQTGKMGTFETRFTVPDLTTDAKRLPISSVVLSYQRETLDSAVATVSFYRGSVKAFETAPLPIADGLNARSKAVPISFTVPLGKLQPGRYTCQVNVIEPSVEKFAVWRSAMVLLP